MLGRSALLAATNSTPTGFGARYANPATLPANVCYGVAFAPAEDAIAVSSFASPYVLAYPWSSTTGFGTKYSNPATLPTDVSTSVKFGPLGDCIAVGQQGSPFITAYPWSSSTGFGTKYTNPFTLPGIGASAYTIVDFSPSGNAIAAASTASPFIHAYSWSASTGFGTKYANPSVLPSGLACGVHFSPAEDAIAVATSTTPYIHAYAWSSSTGFGTKYANPAIIPVASFTAGVSSDTVKYHPSGSAIAMSSQISPYVAAYPWSASSGFGAKFSDPSTPLNGASYEVGFSPSGNALALACSGAIQVYRFSLSAGFIDRLPPPSIAAPDSYGVCFSPSGTAIAVAHTQSPFLSAYRFTP